MIAVEEAVDERLHAVAQRVEGEDREEQERDREPRRARVHVEARHHRVGEGDQEGVDAGDRERHRAVGGRRLRHHADLEELAPHDPVGDRQREDEEREEAEHPREARVEQRARDHRDQRRHERDRRRRAASRRRGRPSCDSRAARRLCAAIPSETNASAIVNQNAAVFATGARMPIAPSKAAATTERKRDRVGQPAQRRIAHDPGAARSDTSVKRWKVVAPISGTLIHTIAHAQRPGTGGSASSAAIDAAEQEERPGRRAIGSQPPDPQADAEIDEPDDRQARSPRSTSAA